jgi:EEF1A N-terminal glycine/lysine methyltransferase
LETHSETLLRGKDILELGAGAGLPSLICALSGARTVVVTDYPDAELIENLDQNIKNNLGSDLNCHAKGYLWGADPLPLTNYVREEGSLAGFDILILADLLFNHSEHAKLLATIQQTLKKSPESQALVFFTPYRPWLLDKDLAFFDLARNAGFVVEQIMEKVMDKVMFEEDPGVSNVDRRQSIVGKRIRSC